MIIVKKNNQPILICDTCKKYKSFKETEKYSVDEIVDNCFNECKNKDVPYVISNDMKEFISKVDALCFEYGYVIQPTIPYLNDEYNTISIIGNSEECKLICIDGDGSE